MDDVAITHLSFGTEVTLPMLIVPSICLCHARSVV